MNLIFWQGIISIHQKAFLEAVAKQPSVEKVMLVVEHDITPYRKSMGWDVPEIEGITVIISPSAEEVENIVTANKDAIHITGGIRVGKMISTAFEACIKNNCRLGIMTEPYNPAGIKGKLRTLKYRYYRMKYAKRIQFILAIGKQGVAQYSQLKFGSNKIFPWAYFINIDKAEKQQPARNKQRIIYAGRIEEAKGIYKFTEQLANARHDNYELDIYGEGPDEQKLQQLIAAKRLSGTIRIYPFLKHAALLQKYPAYDWVVLPSAGKDGWGVIISEGLLYGLKAVCSGMCGVSLVIKDNFNGLVFDWNKEDSCSEAIDKMLTSPSPFAGAKAISDWANQTISADAGAAYFINIIDSLYNNKPKPSAPWDAYKEKKNG